MARLNTAKNIPVITTHEGAPAKRISVEAQLRRSVMSCLLWEREFYEDGKQIADRILELADQLPKEVVADLAREARTEFNLRHVPLLLLTALIRKGGSGVADAIADTIQRADEMAELLALYWRDGRKPVTKQLKLGLAKAFSKFDEYQLAKYDREGVVRLRDVLFLSHPKPDTPEREALYKRVADRQLAVPDTWEVNLSGGGDKRETFERMLREGKLGYMALLRNLRGMMEVGVDEGLVREAILARKNGAHRVLPFRYTAAARACPRLEGFLDQALCEAVSEGPRLSGKTVVLVDISASMKAKLSERSDLTRMDAAATLASVIHGDLRMFSFSNGNGGWGRSSTVPVTVEVPPRRGMAGVDAIIKSQDHSGTLLGQAIREANAIPHDRLIVITDEESNDPVPDPVAKKAYMINVASSRNGVGYGKWTHIDGFSEAVLRYISEHERNMEAA